MKWSLIGFATEWKYWCLFVPKNASMWHVVGGLHKGKWQIMKAWIWITRYLMKSTFGNLGIVWVRVRHGHCLLGTLTTSLLTSSWVRSCVLCNEEAQISWNVCSSKRIVLSSFYTCQSLKLSDNDILTQGMWRDFCGGGKSTRENSVIDMKYAF